MTMSHQNSGQPTVSCRSWGFRFSTGDAVAIAVFGGAAVALAGAGSELGWLLTVASVHFFLFCNVFRIARPLELTWAGLFVLTTGLWAWNDAGLSWVKVLLCQLPLSGTVLWLGIRSPCYHGILADRLNPKLEAYLESQQTRMP